MLPVTSPPLQLNIEVDDNVQQSNADWSPSGLEQGGEQHRSLPGIREVQKKYQR